MSNNAVTQDQAAFWQLFVTTIAGQLPGTDPKNFISAAGAINSNLASESEVVALTDAYNLGNTIPDWGLTWNGAFNTRLFDTYQQWVRDLVPTGGSDSSSGGSSAGGSDSDLDTQIDALRSKIATLSNDVSLIYQGFYEDWLNEVCAELDDSGKTCKIYMSTPPDPTWSSYRTDQLTTDNYKAKVEALESTFGALLGGLTTQLNALLLQKFGPDYQELADASEAVALADPFEPHTTDELQKTSQFQMTIKENDTTASVPRFKTSELQNVRDWLRKQQDAVSANGSPLFADKAKVQITLNDQQVTEKDSSWKFSANVGIPIDWFWLGGKTSDSSSSQYQENYSYDMLITYQDIITVNINPGDWYFEGLLHTYANFNNWMPGTGFIGKQIWGPNGLMNVVVKGVVLGYAPYMRFTSKDWNNTTTKTQWSASASFGIGPFNFESASASGSSYSSFTQQIENGIEIRDTSGVPKVIGLIVDTPNF
ncbi:hypothetical protein [Paenibacillus sp. MMS18-CY102]|uniref:hypothetical protein n=1 Tax=Paenibacillus sp. MMS18-CY102 TaxID=2682849 RepID=UPI0013667685|nr:hypothetical protein [Paenibacillus sp. MMS18-CY102]MWC27804.1 hypothetical protein [Paenibacillus sp. MMS18-CY102]